MVSKRDEEIGCLSRQLNDEISHALRILRDQEHRLHCIEALHQKWMDGSSHEVQQMIDDLRSLLPWDDDNEADSWYFTFNKEDY
jgi:hypothetical protein